MAGILVDTNVLLRSVDQSSPVHAVSLQAIAKLLGDNHTVWITPQLLVELWVVTTRPADVNGLGWATAEAAKQLGMLQMRFPMLPEDNTIFPHWFALVQNHDIKGKRSHDARIAAVLAAYGVPYLLTFNGPDFAVFPHVKVLHPSDVASGTAIIA